MFRAVEMFFEWAVREAFRHLFSGILGHLFKWILKWDFSLILGGVGERCEFDVLVEVGRYT